MTHYDLVASNKTKSWLIIGLFIMFVVGVSYVFSWGLDLGPGFVGWALILSGLMSFGSYWFSDSIVLSISGARPADRKEFFDFYTVTENLAMSLRIPMPKLYVIEDTAMNAFATGRDPQHAVICVTTGLLERLSRSEVEGVIAHELSHVQNYDTRVMSIVTILVGIVALLADWFLRIAAWGGGGRRRNNDGEGSQLQALFFVLGLILALLSPIIAQLIQFAISRRREFLADASGVALTKNPRGLVSALKKISTDPEPLEAANKATAHMYFENPLRNLRSGSSVGWFANLFSTHPPVAERIAALEKLT